MNLRSKLVNFFVLIFVLQGLIFIALFAGCYSSGNIEFDKGYIRIPNFWEGHIMGIAVSPKESYVAWVEEGGKLKVFSLKSKKILFSDNVELDGTWPVPFGFGYSQDESQLLICSQDGKWSGKWNIATGQRLKITKSFVKPDKILFQVPIMNDKFLSLFDRSFRMFPKKENHRIRIWSPETGKIFDEIDSPKYSYRIITTTTDGKKIAIFSQENNYFLKIINFPQLKSLGDYKLPFEDLVVGWDEKKDWMDGRIGFFYGYLTGASFSPDGNKALISSQSSLGVINVSENKIEYIMNFNQLNLSGSCFLSNTDLVLIWDWKNCSHIVNLKNKKITPVGDKTYLNNISCCSISSSGNFLAIGKRNGEVIIQPVDELEKLGHR